MHMQYRKTYRERGAQINYMQHICEYIYIYMNKCQINNLDFYIKKQRNKNKNTA